MAALAALVLLRASALVASLWARLSPGTGPRDTTSLLLREYLRSSGAPGMACIVVYDSHIVFAEALGVADVEQSVPFELTSVVRIASISKPITATALARMAVRGDIELDKGVSEYVTNYPHRKVTVRHLASHVAGVRHFKNNREKKLTRSYPTTEAGVAWYWSDPLLFEPGTKFFYSSFGFAILALVIESCTGISFQRLLQQEVFEPFGMRQCRSDSSTEIIPKRARGYSRSTGKLLNCAHVDNAWKVAGDGLIGSTEDLASFGHGVLTLSAEIQRLMWTPQVLSDGSMTPYGLGWKLSYPSGVGHSGDAVGYSTHLRVWPEQRFVIALTANLSQVPFTPLADRIAAVWNVA